LKKSKKSTTTGATTDGEREKEGRFKRELELLLPEIGEINFTYSSILLKHEMTACFEREGTFGYFMKESVLVNEQPIKIAWLPHSKDMSEKEMLYMTKEVAKSIKLNEKGKSNEETNKRKPRSLGSDS
jgi:hypothetical protein